MYRLLRIISSISVTLIAYLGVKKDFKIDGEITSVGNIVIIVALLLVSISIALEIIEYYRQKRHQQEMNDKFENLKFQLSKPILPFELRCVLKYTTDNIEIEKIYGEQISFFKKIADKFKPGKFIHPGLANFPWDENYETVDYSLCLTEPQILQELIKNRSKIIKEPYSGTIEIYKKVANNKYSKDADLVLEIGGLNEKVLPYSIKDLRLYDKNLYLETYIHQWTIEKNLDNVISIYDLREARMKIKMDIDTYDDDDFEKSIPYLTYLQFKCGDRPYNLITLNKDILGKPKITKNEFIKPSNDEITKKHWANTLTMYYDIILPNEKFENYITQKN